MMDNSYVMNERDHCVRQQVILNRAKIHGKTAITSISTTNSGRVNPVTIISVEDGKVAGGIPPTGPISRGWIAADLNADGTVGDASLATHEKGEATSVHQVNGFIDLLQQVRDADIPSAPATITRTTY